jgi:hypothetical protein
MNKKETWLMTFEEFCKKFKTQNSKQYADDYCQLGKQHCVGCYYYLTVSSDLEIINPYTKKDRNKKKLQTFVSTCSIEDVKTKTFAFILKTALEIGLFEECVCDINIKQQQINWINEN